MGRASILTVAVEYAKIGRAHIKLASLGEDFKLLFFKIIYTHPTL